MDNDKVDYILEYFGHLMTSNESKAWRHHSCLMKLEYRQNSNVEAKERTERQYYKNGWLSTDLNVFSLLNKGIDNYRTDVAIRISKEHKEIVKYNYC